jgi:hypothetical protein
MHIKLPFKKTLIINGPRLHLIPTRDIETVGFWDICEDGLHVILLDYDAIDRIFMFQDLRWLQKAFRLSDFHVLTTKQEKMDICGREETIGSYHCICLDKVPFATAVEIIQRSHCDAAFKRGAFLNIARVWTLRAFEDYRPKPHYITTVKSPFAEYQQSSAHAEFLKKNYGIPVRLSNPDGLELLWLEMYKTKNKEMNRIGQHKNL